MIARTRVVPDGAANPPLDPIRPGSESGSHPSSITIIRHMLHRQNRRANTRLRLGLFPASICWRCFYPIVTCVFFSQGASGVQQAVGGSGNGGSAAQASRRGADGDGSKSMLDNLAEAGQAFGGLFGVRS